MKDRDILLDDALDIEIEGGDFKVGNTLLQNQYLILISNPGEWKQYPYMGVGIEAIVCDEDKGYWQREILEQMKRDGMQVENINIDTMAKNITIKARY